MTLITHPIAFESDSPVGTDIIGTRKLFMMQKMHSSLRKESTDRQPLTTIVNIIVIQQNILCLNMALLIYRVVTSGSIAIVYQILSMNASVFCSIISPRALVSVMSRVVLPETGTNEKTASLLRPVRLSRRLRSSRRQYRRQKKTPPPARRGRKLRRQKPHYGCL